MRLIKATQVAASSAVLDVGAGTSKLAQSLVDAGYSDVSVLDISPAALTLSHKRMRDVADEVQWIEADVVNFCPRRQYAIWHDRAVFHFLTCPAERSRYLQVLKQALLPQQHFIVATFGPEGPERCSGLEVQRYSIEDMTSLFAADFRLRAFELEYHSTPSGSEQQFLYAWWQALV
jgi:trans-aconitate methyltransferase